MVDLVRHISPDALHRGQLRVDMTPSGARFTVMADKDHPIAYFDFDNEKLIDIAKKLLQIGNRIHTKGLIIPATES
jgi:hypothetical protein